MKQIAVRIGGLVVNAGSQTIVLDRNGAPPVTSSTSAKQDEGWEIVSANIFWM